MAKSQRNLTLEILLITECKIWMETRSNMLKSMGKDMDLESSAYFSNMAPDTKENISMWLETSWNCLCFQKLDCYNTYRHEHGWVHICCFLMTIFSFANNLFSWNNVIFWLSTSWAFISVRVDQINIKFLSTLHCLQCRKKKPSAIMDICDLERCEVHMWPREMWTFTCYWQ